MSDLQDSFFEWVAGQTLAGYKPQLVEKGLVSFACGHLRADVAFFSCSDNDPMVEMRAGRSYAFEPSFLTRFVLSDRWRARALFREMSSIVESEIRRGTPKVLVCCAGDDHDLRFVEKLNGVNHLLPLNFEFVAVKANDAFLLQDVHTATLLTPRMASLQKRMFRAHPHAVTFCIPKALYEREDALMTARLMVEALGEIEPPPARPHTVRALRPLPTCGRVLVLNIMYLDRCVRMGFRLYENDHVRIRGAFVKSKLTMRDLDDLLDTLAHKGIPTCKIDALGILVPGVVNFCSMNLPSLGCRDEDLAEKLQCSYGIPVFIDNNTNAAAMGCYMLDIEHESLTLYRHQLGHKNGGQGTVLDGRLVTGRYNLAGEPKFYQRRFRYTSTSDCYAEAVWSESGLSEIAKDVLLATIGTVSPDAAYLSVSTIESTESMCRSLERLLPKYCIPELMAIDDYRERMYLGEVTLCLGRICPSGTKPC